MLTLFKNRKLLILIATLISLFSTSAYADIDSSGILDDVLVEYQAQTALWAVIMQDAAQWLFWLLVTISMVFTFGYMALGKADIGEFFAEFIRFIIFVGFFQWLLLNGPNFSNDIINSLRQLAGDASGLGAGLTPSGIVDIGFDIIGRIFDASSIWSPLDSLLGIVLGLIILLILAMIGINMLILLISAWFLSFAGIFFLGFGGSKWTSDMAVNYYKTVLGLAAELMAMILLVGIGQNIIIQYQNDMSGEIQLVELCVMLIVAVTLFLLTTKIPPMLSGVISGTSFGGPSGVSGGGALAAAAALATAGAALAAGVASAATSVAGGGSAISAAFKEAQATIQSSGGGDSIGSTLSGVNSGEQDFNSSGINDNSDFAVSMGDSSTPSDISSTTSDSNSSESESASADSGSLSGDAESASADSGSLSGDAESASADSSSADSSSADSSSADSSSADSSSADSSSADSSSADSSSADSSSADSSSADSSSADSSSADSSKGSFGQAMKKASSIAGLTLQNLSKGAVAAASNAVGEKMDSMKDSIAQTAGGKIADEIKNPNQAKQQREDSKIVAAAEASASKQEISQKAEEIRRTDAKEETSDDEISSFENKE